ncbi:LacI family DNA-binding transcriptional regulator [Brachybacterium sp. DNPG3]
MTTLADVAKEAGVSMMTVSNVLAGRTKKVSEKTAQRVREAVEATGYVPSGAARALSRRRSRIVALVVQGDGSAMTSTHDARYVGELARILQVRGYVSMLIPAADLRATAASLRSWNVEGAIVINTLGTEIERLLDAHDVPMLFSDNYSDADGALTVCADDVTGGRLAAEHLIRHGHRDALFLGPLRGVVSVDDERWRGFRTAFEDAGLPAPRTSIAISETTVAAGFEVAAQVVALEPRPTAVFCAADDLAAGLLRGLVAAGVRVPEDISVIGFDGFDIAQVTRPTLTTIGQDMTSKAEQSVDLLLAALDDGVQAAAAKHPEPIPVRLIDGESVADRL